MRNKNQALAFDLIKPSTDADMKNEELGEREVSKKPDAEYKIYKNFWGVQKYMNNPIYVREISWKQGSYNQL